MKELAALLSQMQDTGLVSDYAVFGAVAQIGPAIPVPRKQA